jgi:isopenicillin N synthase-like dioxygenase
MQDFECFTILSQDSVPALQVLNSSNQWVTATPIPDTLVVNVGDFMSVWQVHALFLCLIFYHVHDLST